ncbi:hypothetical protein FNF27_03472 [Cafeteria roenbergensis]|uniref:Calmodulin n=1 Tax=Cafeteria roenbergensis TaxID=33653 RepID=A0A5A8CA66_CAFRO|nr:hypothetical protein FNF29_05631 [Cafeteria roenbergensis]KAA0151071.1 hypothetical protein FNF28_07180 [Cafeteria roenbergensis]KAA0161459.1 hypothetical protein FNF31_03742 [Cafeteria roenbergensis]KAA0175175.1 hypothetical protein FNF27_03472 [Cafeteria roenbergensis]|mmetsp:Transcript_3481/g.14389  ORF Transcript_3481/g.14389 Transcript_3481/m.14389 type:complete len:152 (+) Transcript_3481:179-634(+)|eukprot:KAA0149805.1 hypothetical protein FNF29_05631 [Cafeteria roenbergensis]
MDQLRPDQVAGLREIYGLFDFSGAGRMDSRALGAVLRTVGVDVSESELSALIAQLSVGSSAGDASIDQEEFIHLMASVMADADPEEEADSSFQAFDVDADGRVGAEDLRVAAASLGIELDAAACAEMLEEVAAKPERGASREEFCAAALQG